MAASSSRIAKLVSKFRGCLVGSILGDCIGTPFEGEYPVPPNTLDRFFKKLKDPLYQAPFFPFSDDTLMIRCVGESLVHKHDYDASDMAQRFADEYRGSDMNEDIFKLLRAWKYIDVYRPAQEAFQGTGSFFNGAAVRVPPIPMFYFGDIEKAIMIATDSAKLTHAHSDGYNGAVLHCVAVHQALIRDSEKPMDAQLFVNELLDVMEGVECQTYKRNTKSPRNYVKQLEKVKEFLRNGNTRISDVAGVLGNDIHALKSVPTSIFIFLRSLEQIPNIEADNPIERAIHYAVLLGRDTDTIGCMTGSLCGAYFGIEKMPEGLLRRCEGVNDNIHLADRLYEGVERRKQEKQA